MKAVSCQGLFGELTVMMVHKFRESIYTHHIHWNSECKMVTPRSNPRFWSFIECTSKEEFSKQSLLQMHYYNIQTMCQKKQNTGN